MPSLVVPHQNEGRRQNDEDLEVKYQNTASLQKWVNLYDIMLDNFKGEGHCVMMDSAYMGDIMALIGGHEWKNNMVGTVQENRTGTVSYTHLRAHETLRHL
eukprot:10820548-Ditylum_brightwellii.AAC.1